MKRWLQAWFQKIWHKRSTALQMPGVIKEAKAALAGGSSVVLGLQTTGEAAADAMGLEHGKVCGFVSTTKELLQRFVATHFPTRHVPTAEEGVPSLELVSPVKLHFRVASVLITGSDSRLKHLSISDLVERAASDGQ